MPVVGCQPFVTIVTSVVISCWWVCLCLSVCNVSLETCTCITSVYYYTTIKRENEVYSKRVQSFRAQVKTLVPIVLTQFIQKLSLLRCQFIISIYYLELGPRVFPEPNLGKTSNSTSWPSICLSFCLCCQLPEEDMTVTSSTHGPGANVLWFMKVVRVYGGCISSAWL